MAGPASSRIRGRRLTADPESANRISMDWLRLQAVRGEPGMVESMLRHDGIVEIPAMETSPAGGIPAADGAIRREGVDDIIREPRAESREPRAESREPRAESREPRAESREPRAESREPRAESREPRAESREPRAESREPRAESREPRAYGSVMSAGAHDAPAERMRIAPAA